MTAPSRLFHPAVAAWFERTFRAPTAAQTQAWPAIKTGRNVLVAAPTGSGKTFAAFMAAIDDLVRQGLDGGLRDETQVVYVSTLRCPASARRFGSKASAISTSARGCAPAIPPQGNVSAWSAGHRTSSSRRRNLFMSCLDLMPAAG